MAKIPTFQAMQWEEQEFPNEENDYSGIVQVDLNPNELIKAGPKRLSGD